MAEKLQPVRGTHDILPDDFEKFQAVVTLARELATLYGFREMATPIFEATEVFSRSMGETSDVVSKEMFNFDTKGGEGVCLRPEFTAGIARAFISNGMAQHLPLKLFSTGPLFRYERPQKGRQRQFHQVNFEWLGDDSPEADVEMILLAGHLLYTLSGNKGCTLLINTLGDKESRANYRDALVAYLMPFESQLSEDSKRRLTSNPLRILDSKSAEDQKILEAAPKITEFLSDATSARFRTICDALNNKQIPFFQEVRIEPKLVRGLDYYTDTVFEFVAETGELGAQNTVLAGGRYDGLIEQMGGKPTPAIGFAAGVERLLLLASDEALSKVDKVKIIVLPLEEMPANNVHWIVGMLRLGLAGLSNSERQFSAEILWQGSEKKRMQKADNKGAAYVITLAPNQAANIKNMKTGVTKLLGLDAKLADAKELAALLEIN